MDYVSKIKPLIKGHTEALNKLLVEKAEGYGPSWRVTGKMIAELFPEGIPADSMQEVLLMVRVCDKLCRLAQRTRVSKEVTAKASDENPWFDIAGYGVLAMCAEDMDRGKASLTELCRGPQSDEDLLDHLLAMRRV